MYYIYRAFNIISHKSYIGLTTRTIDKRWDEHVKYAQKDCGCDYNTVLSRAIRKYPDYTWKVYSLDTTDNIDHLKELEIYYIAKYHTFVKDSKCNGYNSTRGGDLGCEFNYIPVDSVDIISGIILKHFDNIADSNRYYHARSESICKDGISFLKNYKSICIIPSSLIKNMNHNELINYINLKCPNIVYKLDTKGNIIDRYINTQDAHNKTKISQANISCSCNLIRRMAGGYQWCYQKDLDKRVNKKLKELKLGKPIVQYGMDGHKIKVWKNTEEAARFYGVNGSHITSCCTGKRQSCLKFQWRFLSDNIDKLNPTNQKRGVKCVETGEIFETRNDAAKHFHVDFSTIESSLTVKGYTYPIHLLMNNN